MTGRVAAVDADEVVLDSTGSDRRLRLADVRRAKVQVEFAASPAGEQDAAPGTGAAGDDDADDEGEV